MNEGNGHVVLNWKIKLFSVRDKNVRRDFVWKKCWFWTKFDCFINNLASQQRHINDSVKLKKKMNKTTERWDNFIKRFKHVVFSILNRSFKTEKNVSLNVSCYDYNEHGQKISVIIQANESVRFRCWGRKCHKCTQYTHCGVSIILKNNNEPTPICRWRTYTILFDIMSPSHVVTSDRVQIHLNSSSAHLFWLWFDYIPLIKHFCSLSSFELVSMWMAQYDGWQTKLATFNQSYQIE